MKQTDQTLLEQMRITDFEIDYRKNLFSFTEADAKLLRELRPAIERRLNSLVKQFYEAQTNIPEIAVVIGDAETLGRLQNAQRKYISDLVSGFYDLEYANNRLRIGLVHKRIGVEPKLYLAAVYSLKNLINNTIAEVLTDPEQIRTTQAALAKLFMFDISLVFETYIRSLVSEIETSRNKSEEYARLLEDRVRERTKQLEEMTRTDSLTGLLNVRYLEDILMRSLRAAQRRLEPISVVYMDINDFKHINDNQGHQRGDEILRIVGNTIRSVSRLEDSCFRYGGDEFLIILPNCRKEQAHEIYMERLTKELTITLPDVSLSIGVAQTGPDSYIEAIEFVRIADERMYAAKKILKMHKTTPN